VEERAAGGEALGLVVELDVAQAHAPARADPDGRHDLAGPARGRPHHRRRTSRNTDAPPIAPRARYTRAPSACGLDEELGVDRSAISSSRHCAERAGLTARILPRAAGSRLSRERRDRGLDRGGVVFAARSGERGHRVERRVARLGSTGIAASGAARRPGAGPLRSAARQDARR
jgi:hypothetical protein